MKQLYLIYKYYKSKKFRKTCKTYRFVSRVGKKYELSFKILGEVIHIHRYFSDKVYRKQNKLFGFLELKTLKKINVDFKKVSDNLWNKSREKEAEEKSEKPPVCW